MTTSAQVAANHSNSQLSTGPRTELGKAVASHQSEFNSLLDRYRQQFAVKGEHESFLVEQMARSRWKLARIQRLETAAFERASEAGSAQDWNALATLQRYAAAAERSYYKAHRGLQQSRDDDPTVEHTQAAPSNIAEIRPARTPAKLALFRNSEAELPARRAA